MTHACQCNFKQVLEENELAIKTSTTPVSLSASEWVLTAAHCLVNMWKVIVLGGMKDLKDKERI